MQRPVFAALLLASFALPAQARTQVSDPPPPPPIGEEEVWDLPGDAPPPPPPQAPAMAPQATPMAPAAEARQSGEIDDGATAEPADREAWEAEQRYYEEQERQSAEEALDAAEADADAAAEDVTYESARSARSSGSNHVTTVDQPFFSLEIAGAGTSPDDRRAGDFSAVDVGMRFEGERFGFLARIGGLGVHQGTSFFNLSLEPTYAIAATDNFRLRLRAGWAYSATEYVSMGGLSLGASMVLCLVGPLDLEADVTVVPLPFSRVDANVGLALNFGVVSFRMGWKTAHQDDRGHGTGSVAFVRYNGLYGGAGLHF